MTHDKIAELITRRRRQILVHSVIYYRYNDNIISDEKWTQWAKELEKLQYEYPDISKECPLAEAFEGFDHSTGFDLPLSDPWAMAKAEQLLNWRNKECGEGIMGIQFSIPGTSEYDYDTNNYDSKCEWLKGETQ